MDHPIETLGDRVEVRNYGMGIVKYVGRTHFATGFFIGVELDRPLGKHDGLYDGKRYFHARDQHAIFVRPPRLSRPAVTSKFSVAFQNGLVLEVLPPSDGTPLIENDILARVKFVAENCKRELKYLEKGDDSTTIEKPAAGLVSEPIKAPNMDEPSEKEEMDDSSSDEDRIEELEAKERRILELEDEVAEYNSQLASTKKELQNKTKSIARLEKKCRDLKFAWDESLELKEKIKNLEYQILYGDGEKDEEIQRLQKEISTTKSSQ